jgi:hypothetical protein
MGRFGKKMSIRGLPQEATVAETSHERLRPIRPRSGAPANAALREEPFSAAAISDIRTKARKRLAEKMRINDSGEALPAGHSSTTKELSAS